MRYILYGFILAAIITGVVYAQTQEQHAWIIAKRLTVNGISRLGGDTAVDGTLTGDDLRLSGDLDIDGNLAFTVQPVITVTNGAPFTPTGFLQPIASAGTVTPSLGTLPVGRVVVVWNDGDENIVFVDNATHLLDGNVTLGPGDPLIVLSDGERVMKLAGSNN